MPAFSFLRLSDRLSCQGSVTTFGVLHPDEEHVVFDSGGDIQAVEDQESMSFRCSRVNADGDVNDLVANLRSGRVISVVESDDSFKEWRVGLVTDGRGQGGLIQVECVPIWRDLVERCANAGGQGWVSQVVGGERIFDYDITERLCSDILQNFVIANGPNYITLGDVDNDIVLSAVSVKHLVPWALALAVRDTRRAIDVAGELRLRRNGTTDYKLDIVTEIGSSAAVPVFHPRNSLVTLTRKIDATLQATRVLVTGGTAPDTLPGILGRARWRGAAPSGLTIALSDPNGGAGPIGFDGQWVGNYLLRVKTGRTMAITASNASAQTVTFTDVSDIAGVEDYEFRLTEPQTNTRRIGAAQVNHAAILYEVTNVDGGTKKLTLTDNVNNQTLDPVAANGNYVDWQGQRYALVLQTALRTAFSGSPYSAGVVAVAATTGVAAGDLCIVTTNATAPYLWQAPEVDAFPVLVVDSVGAGPVATCHARDGALPVGLFGSGVCGGAGYARFYRAAATKHLITASDATANTITVTAVGTAAATDVVEIIQVLGAGERPAYVDHPTYVQADPTGYGVKIMELQRANQLGIQQLIPDSWQRTWSNHAIEPDGWTDDFAFADLSRDTAAARFAGNSIAFTAMAGGAKHIYAPPFYPAWDDTHRNVALRGWVYYSLIPTPNTATGTLTLYRRNADGTVGSAVSGSTAGVCFAPGGSTGFVQVAAGGWLEFRIEGTDLLSTDCDYGMVVGFAPASGGTASGFLDTLEAYPFATCPTASYEFGDAVGLHQAGNSKLGDVAAPLAFYTLAVFDLARAFPDEYAPLALTLGGSVRVRDVDYGIDTTVRCLKIERDLLNNANSVLTLANRPTLLTNVININVLQPVMPAATLVTNAGSAVVLTAPAPAPVLANPSGAPPTSDGSAPPAIQPGDTVTTIPPGPPQPGGQFQSSTIVAQPIGGQPPVPPPPIGISFG